MHIKKLTPRRGEGTYRIEDSDDLVVMENVDLRNIPGGRFSREHHRIALLCTSGRAQFEYDGITYVMEKNDLFFYMRQYTIGNFMASSDFNGRQIWFTRSEMWNINIYGEISIIDMVYLKQHPKVHLTDNEMSLMESYFQLLFSRMKDRSLMLYSDIVRSLVSTLMLEMLALYHREEEKVMLPANRPRQDNHGDDSSNLQRRSLADRFMSLVEQSDGRIRKVESFANQLDITPKYLSAILKETMNCRPSVIIQLFTMKAIERRLRFTDMTMQEIANDLNYPNPSFFGRYCKEHLGMTPLEYRMKYHKGK